MDVLGKCKLFMNKNTQHARCEGRGNKKLEKNLFFFRDDFLERVTKLTVTFDSISLSSTSHSPLLSFYLFFTHFFVQLRWTINTHHSLSLSPLAPFFEKLFLTDAFSRTHSKCRRNRRYFSFRDGNLRC